jgi:hypothetical protein
MEQADKALKHRCTNGLCDVPFDKEAQRECRYHVPSYDVYGCQNLLKFDGQSCREPKK